MGSGNSKAKEEAKAAKLAAKEEAKRAKEEEKAAKLAAKEEAKRSKEEAKGTASPLSRTRPPRTRPPAPRAQLHGELTACDVSAGALSLSLSQMAGLGRRRR